MKPSKRTPAKPSASKALVRHRPQPARRRAETPPPANPLAFLLPPSPPLPAPPPPEPPRSVLTDDVAFESYGKKDLKITEKEEAVCAEAVPLEEVRVKPTGQVFLSHTTYTRWLNRAFGRLGWALVPKALPTRNERGIVMAHQLYIHGDEVGMAWGEQDYHESNKEQTYGDAVEATHASALRRCCKHLGIGLELWDKEWIARFLHEFAVRVPCREYDGKTKWQWRLKRSAPFWNEQQGGQPSDPHYDYDDVRPDQAARQTTRPPERPRPPAATNPQGDAKITEPQVKRFWVIARKAKRTESEVKIWLANIYGVDHTHDILRKHYNEICAALEAPGPLGGGAVPAAREPGQEG